MKLSVLLPTRNRLDLLRYAIESVRMQDDPDWEIVVADNASSDDVPGYVASLSDSRIRCFRGDRLLPVTENWNVALSRGTGDYFLMLGDDDALLPKCLSQARALIDKWERPDALYVQAYQFAYPGVIPGYQKGFVQVGYNGFLPAEGEPFLVAQKTAIAMVRAALSFRIRYGFNMQHFIFSRRLVDALRDRGPFFQSPYPDYYAANAILLRAERLVAEPRPLVMIGISPRSFGFFYFNRRENEGVEFLQNVTSEPVLNRLRGTLVPGSNMNDSWLCAMETLALNFPDRPSELRVDYRRYRLLQYQALLRAQGWGALPVLAKHVRLLDALWYGPAAIAFALTYFVPSAWRLVAQDKLAVALSAFPRFDARRVEVPYRDILEAVRGYSS